MIAKVVLEKYLAFSSGVFDYNVPMELQSDLKVGQIVKVPFQKGFFNALVVSIVGSWELGVGSIKSPLRGLGGGDIAKDFSTPLFFAKATNNSGRNDAIKGIKSIEQILCSDSFLSERDLLIAQEIAHYYLCSIAQVLKLFLPKNFWQNKIHKPQVVFYFLNSEIDFSQEKIRGKNQMALLNDLKPLGKLSLEKVQKLPAYSATSFKALVTKDWVKKEVQDLKPSDLITEVVRMKNLNVEQKEALQMILKSEKPVLLHGITGSGKTEVYLHVIRASLEKGKTALVLVPEIVLTTQIVEYFENVFGEAVGVIHSKLSDGEKEKIWWQIKLGQKKVIIGSRSALFYPYPRLGAIVVDEAHEWYYKSDQSPRYHTVKVAEIMARYHEAKLVLGTATPGVEEYFRATSHKLQASSFLKVPLACTVCDEKGDTGGLKPQEKLQTTQPPFQGGVEKTQNPPNHLSSTADRYQGGFKKIQTTDYQLITLKKRIYEDEISGEKFTRESKLPEVRIVDLREEFQKKNFTPFSDLLLKELKTVLENGEQAVLFLNKRGTASSLICRECGYVAKCKACDVGLTYHQKGSFGKLVCHYCGRMQDLPLLCPHCQSPQIKFGGAGTQKIEQDLKKLFPNAKIARVDRDTTSAKDAHTELYSALKNEEIDIVVGTQIIAKGFDLPKVSLVGVLNADIGLNIPDFRSGEKIFQVLTQVTGRAGRRAKQGKVLLQTYNPENFVLQAIARHDYLIFYENEIKMRTELAWPPFASVVKLTFADYSIKKVLQKVDELKKNLQKMTVGKSVEVLSAPALIPKMHNKYHWNIILKGDNPAEILRQINFPPGWRVDRDPVQVS